jgi:hypothetical protein
MAPRGCNPWQPVANHSAIFVEPHAADSKCGSVCELLRPVAAAADLAEKVEQFADLVALLRWVAHLGFLVDHVAVPSAASFAFEESGFGEVDHDPLGCSFGDADRLGDVSESDVGIVGYAKQHLSVVCEERPMGCSIA